MQIVFTKRKDFIKRLILIIVFNALIDVSMGLLNVFLILKNKIDWLYFIGDCKILRNDFIKKKEVFENKKMRLDNKLALNKIK